MALLKSLQTRTGAVASYWNIQQISVDYQKQGIRVRLLGWVSEAVRRHPEGVALTDKVVDIVGDKFFVEPTREKLYSAIKESSLFAGAEDAVPPVPATGTLSKATCGLMLESTADSEGKTPKEIAMNNGGRD